MAQPQETPDISHLPDYLLTFAQVAAVLQISERSIESAHSGGRMLIQVVSPTARKRRIKWSDLQRVISGEVQIFSPDPLDPAKKRAMDERAAQAEVANA